MRIVLFTASDTTNLDPMGLSLELSGDDQEVVFSVLMNGGKLKYNFRMSAAELVHQINLVTGGCDKCAHEEWDFDEHEWRCPTCGEIILDRED